MKLVKILARWVRGHRRTLPSARQRARYFRRAGCFRRAQAGNVLVTLLISAPPALAARTDVVVIANGDHFTGEVKSLDRARLRLKTDDAGDVYIEWNKIRHVEASAQFDVETVSGHHVMGSLRSTEQDGRLHIVGAEDSTALGFESVVRMTPLHATFWGKVDGSLDAGSTFALANHLVQLNVAVNAKYRQRKFSVGTDLNTTLVHQDSVTDTRRLTLGLSYARYFENRWQTQSETRLERNDQLGLELRVSADAGIARHLLQSNTTLFDAGAELSVNQEQQTDGGTVYNLEAIFLTTFSTFVYDSPKVNVDTYLRFYPSLSDWGRLRLEASAVAKREIVKDFFLGLNAVESYDNQPPKGVTNHDWNVYLSIGWTF